MKDWNGNSNSIYKTLGASNHTDKERGLTERLSCGYRQDSRCYYITGRKIHQTKNQSEI